MNHWEEYFYYDETSPSGLRWTCDAMRGRKYSSFARRRGDVAGSCKGVNGRWQLVLNKKNFLVHRVIYEMLRGAIPEGHVVDHINGDFRDNRIENLRDVPFSHNTRNAKKREDNQSGSAGVHVTTNLDRQGCEYFYFTATWRVEGKQRSKHFAFSKYGEQEALRLACEYRVKMIEELNLQGAGYTERHGT